MEYPSYSADASPTFTEFEFESTGTKGAFTHLIKYSRIPGQHGFYNLGFGRKNDDHTIDDTHINDNGDRDLILATVVKSAYAFSEQYAGKYIVFKGSTESRTRMYRMLLSAQYNTLSRDFMIWGLVNNEYMEFVPNTTTRFEWFVVLRRLRTI